MRVLSENLTLTTILLDVKTLNPSSSLVYRFQIWRHQAVSLPPGHEWHHCKLFVLRLAPCHAHAAGACLQYPWTALSLLTPQFPKIPPIFLRWLRADFSLSRELVASLEIAKAEHAQKDNILFISCRSCLLNTMWPFCSIILWNAQLIEILVFRYVSISYIRFGK